MSIQSILEAVRTGQLSTGKAEKLLKLDAVAIVGDFARVDTNRFRRRGVPEIIYAQSKTINQLSSIVLELARAQLKNGSSDPIVLSRMSPEQYDAFKARLERKTYRSFLKGSKLKTKYYSEAAIGTAFVALHRTTKTNHKWSRNDADHGRIAILSAGTSDAFAVAEAETVSKLMGASVIKFNDVGVAAIHRLKRPLERILRFDPDAIIVAAGMEAALTSVVAGLLDIPIIGVPLSSGYGFGGRGEAALMSMLQACPLGISVVNIDSGLAAGITASLIARRCAKSRGLLK